MNNLAISDNKKIINIAYACNNAFVAPLCTSIVSLADNVNKNYCLKIYILYSEDNLTQENRIIISNIVKKYNIEIEFLCITSNAYENFIIPEGYGWSVEIFYRLFLASLLPDVEKIIYLDSDTIILSDISELYNTNIDHHCVAAIENYNKESVLKEYCSRLGLDSKYFNSGVLLMNLNAFRKESIETKLFDFAKNNSDIILCPDQDILNVVLKDRVKYLDISWNAQNIHDNIPIKANKIKIYHYSGALKPWNEDYSFKNEKKYFFKYFKKLPLSLQISGYYYPERKKILKNIRKKLIWYRKSEKSLILFNFIKIRLFVQ